MAARVNTMMVLFLLSLVVLHLTLATADASYYAPIDCGASCAARCSLSSRPRLCNRACGSCCRRCNCVPPGTYGNYDACPCYASLTTHHNRKKCP